MIFRWQWNGGINSSIASLYLALRGRRGRSWAGKGIWEVSQQFSRWEIWMWGEVLWHRWVLWSAAGRPWLCVSRAVELCVFCSVRREGDKVKQYSHCWSKLAQFTHSLQQWHQHAPCCCLCVHIFSSPACDLSHKACADACVSMRPVFYVMSRAKKLHECLFYYMLECQTDIIAVWRPGDISLYPSEYPRSI